MVDPVTDELTRRYVAIGFEDLPQATVASARRVLLDATGVMIAASALAEEAAPFLALAARSPGPCTILGAQMTASAPMAAFANGALAHALDYEDAFDASPGHPNASLVPALLALAQHGAPVDGRRMLTAIAVGCDLSCRIGLALDRRMEEGGWYPPPINAAFGAALGAGHLLGLDAGGLRDAISLMLCQAVMPGEIKYSRGTVLRAVREAFPAQAAVISAELARDGVAGFETPLEGKSGFYALYAGGRFSPTRLLADIGERFTVDELTFKPWPSCRGTHPFIELALALRDRVGDPAAIDSVIVEVSEVQRMLIEPVDRKRAPGVVIDAKFSIPFAFALAMLRGDPGLDNFTPAALRDDAVLGLAAKVSARPVTAGGLDQGAGGRVEIRMKDGTAVTGEVAIARGAPSRPLGDDMLRAKFIDCVQRGRAPMTRDAAERMADAILSSEHCADIGAVFA